MEKLLSVGVLKLIIAGGQPARPVVQILAFKRLNSEWPDTDRDTGVQSIEPKFRLMVSDGIETHQYCLVSDETLSFGLNGGNLEKWSIVCLTDYSIVESKNEHGGRRVLIHVNGIEAIKSGLDVGNRVVVDQHARADECRAGPSVEPATPVRVEMDTIQVIDLTDPEPEPYPQDTNNNGVSPSLSAGMATVAHPWGSKQRVDIQDLSPYIGNWIILARVVAKSLARKYNNARGAGKLFNFTLADKTGEIKVTAFNRDLDRVFSKIELNKVYMLSRADVKAANKRYNSADFEITLNSFSILDEVPDFDKDDDIPHARFNFLPIESLVGCSAMEQVDLIGVVLHISEVCDVVSKTKKADMKKRNITIVDASYHSIDVTMWGQGAENFAGNEGDVFVARAARISTFGGKSATAGDCVFLNPSIKETVSIKDWYANRDERNFKHLTSPGGGPPVRCDTWRTLEQLCDLGRARLEQFSGASSGVYACCKATILSVRNSPLYKCCPFEGCSKKLTDIAGGRYRCDKCNKDCQDYKFRYRAEIDIADHSASLCVTLWDNKAEQLFGLEASKLGDCMNQGNIILYDRIIKKISFKTVVFTFRSRLEIYNGEERVRLDVVGMSPVDHIACAKRIIDEIYSYKDN